MSADAASSLVHEWWVVSLVLPLGLWPPIWHRFAIAASVSAVPLVLLPLLARLQGGGTQQGHAADQAQMSGDDTRDSVSVSTAAVNAPPCNGVLHVLVVGCSNVLPADKNGKSDVYVRVMLGQQQQQHKKTTVKSKTLNPVFNEQLDIEINSNRLQEQGQLSSLGTAAAAPWSLSVEAWDRDVSRDDFLGEATVDLPSMFASAGGRGGGWCANVFLVHLSHIIMIILPRQARDKRRKSTPKRSNFSGVAVRRLTASMSSPTRIAGYQVRSSKTWMRASQQQQQPAGGASIRARVFVRMAACV
jgi:hypothetical protein